MPKITAKYFSNNLLASQSRVLVATPRYKALALLLLNPIPRKIDIPANLIDSSIGVKRSQLHIA
ncbi:hypothetical protein [Nostoc sp. CALU 546]|uniref:hypothetical protein n=1 Tax=Nostoc sp. CALU 546 TaxID=1867241 RepID=UPI003B675EBF